MNLILVCKKGGSVAHLVPANAKVAGLPEGIEVYEGRALCGERTAQHQYRRYWHAVGRFQVISRKCAACERVAHGQQRKDITEGLMVAQAVEASRYED